MPNINIHTIKGVRSPEELRKLADVVQQCSLDYFKAPPKDRYQVRMAHLTFEPIDPSFSPSVSTPNMLLC